jgi:hypothetical protein
MNPEQTQKLKTVIGDRKKIILSVLLYLLWYSWTVNSENKISDHHTPWDETLPTMNLETIHKLKTADKDSRKQATPPENTLLKQMDNLMKDMNLTENKLQFLRSRKSKKTEEKLKETEDNLRSQREQAISTARMMLNQLEEIIHRVYSRQPRVVNSNEYFETHSLIIRLDEILNLIPEEQRYNLQTDFLNRTHLAGNEKGVTVVPDNSSFYDFHRMTFASELIRDMLKQATIQTTEEQRGEAEWIPVDHFELKRTRLTLEDEEEIKKLTKAFAESASNSSDPEDIPKVGAKTSASRAETMRARYSEYRAFMNTQRTDTEYSARIPEVPRDARGWFNTVSHPTTRNLPIGHQTRELNWNPARNLAMGHRIREFDWVATRERQSLQTRNIPTMQQMGDIPFEWQSMDEIRAIIMETGRNEQPVAQESTKVEVEAGAPADDWISQDSHLYGEGGLGEAMRRMDGDTEYQQHDKPLCIICSKPGKRCCGKTYYCGKNCQKSDWKRHNIECKNKDKKKNDAKSDSIAQSSRQSHHSRHSNASSTNDTSAAYTDEDESVIITRRILRKVSMFTEMAYNEGIVTPELEMLKSKALRDLNIFISNSIRHENEDDTPRIRSIHIMETFKHLFQKLANHNPSEIRALLYLFSNFPPELKAPSDVTEKIQKFYNENSDLITVHLTPPDVIDVSDEDVAQIKDFDNRQETTLFLLNTFKQNVLLFLRGDNQCFDCF